MSDTPINVFSIGLWIMFAAVIAIAGAYLALAVKRWYFRDDQPRETFTLQDLREMKKRGEISDHEFHAMRTALLGKYAQDVPDDRDNQSDTQRGQTDADR